MLSENGLFKTRQFLEQREEITSAFYALKSARAKRLIDMTPEGRIFDYRTEFQRDRDRIIYSRAFRRLRNKGRVTRTADEDHARDMFSHTIEVSQIARTIGRSLKLNEDLIEAVSLGHELGIPPFGETGEMLLDSFLHGKFPGGIIVAKIHRGGFRKNRQSLRIVDFLEKRYDYEGLNLTNETREGIMKQNEWGAHIEYPDLKREGLHLPDAPSFEAQVVHIADDIATQVESLDDGLRCKELSLEEIERTPIIKELIRKVGQRYASLKNDYMKIATLNRGLTHLLVTNVIYQSSRSLEKWLVKNRVDSVETFYKTRKLVMGDEISFSQQVNRLFSTMKQFVMKRLTSSSYFQREQEKAKKVIEGLFQAYYSNPLVVEDYILLRYKKLRGLQFLRDIPDRKLEKEIARHYREDPAFIRLICDHIAGMTDNYAFREYERLSLPAVAL